MEEINSLMDQLYHTMPFFPMMILEALIPSLAFTLWLPVEQSIPPQPNPMSPPKQLNKGTNQTLNYLRESNIDLEKIQEKLRVPKSKVLLM